MMNEPSIILYKTASVFYNASGDTSPKVFRSAALIALTIERASSPYSDTLSMVSWVMVTSQPETDERR